MQGAFQRFLHTQFAPPRFLSMPTAGIDMSVSGIKVVTLKESVRGLILDQYGEEPLPQGAIVGGEITDHAVVIDVLKKISKKYNIQHANITLPEARSGYNFRAYKPCFRKHGKKS